MIFFPESILTGPKTKYTDNLHINKNISGISNTFSFLNINKQTHIAHQGQLSADSGLSGFKTFCSSVMEEERAGELILNHQNNHSELSLMPVNTENRYSQSGSILDVMLINLPFKYNHIRLKILLFVLINYKCQAWLEGDPDSYNTIRKFCFYK